MSQNDQRNVKISMIYKICNIFITTKSKIIIITRHKISQFHMLKNKKQKIKRNTRQNRNDCNDFI